MRDIIDIARDCVLEAQYQELHPYLKVMVNMLNEPTKTTPDVPLPLRRTVSGEFNTIK